MKKEGKIQNYIKSIEESIIDPLVAQAVSERQPSELENPQSFGKRLKTKMLESLGQFVQMNQKAVAILQQYKKWPTGERFEQIKGLSKDPKVWQAKIENGESLQKILQFSNEELIDFYEVAREIFQKGLYHEARNIFLFLTQLNPAIASFWYGLGLVEEKVGDVESAFQAYLFSAETNNDSLDYYFKTANFLLLHNENEKAQKVLIRALERVEENSAFQQYEEKINQLLKTITS